MKDERYKIKGEVESFHFLGDEIICPEKLIHEICQKATWIESRGSKINSWIKARICGEILRCG